MQAPKLCGALTSPTLECAAKSRRFRKTDEGGYLIDAKHGIYQIVACHGLAHTVENSLKTTTPFLQTAPQSS